MILRIALMWDTCVSTPTPKLNYLLLLDKDMQNSDNHYSYICVSMHMCDLLVSYSDPEQGEAYQYEVVVHSK